VTSEAIITLIASFLGGSSVGVILSWIRANRLERESRKVQDLKDQVRHLYGPLYFFTSQNENLFKLNHKIMSAYSAEYSNEKWSRDKNTQESLKKERSAIFGTANEYIRIVEKNNEKVISLLTENYFYIDFDDEEIFQQFVIDYRRLTTEVDGQDERALPLEVYQKVGEISFMRPEFMEIVKNKFQQKKATLKNHQKGWF
jgi:hypothetical protein